MMQTWYKHKWIYQSNMTIWLQPLTHFPQGVVEEEISARRTVQSLGRELGQTKIWIPETKLEPKKLMVWSLERILLFYQGVRLC